MNKPDRKTHVLMIERLFETVKRFYKSKSEQEILEKTKLSKGVHSIV